MSRSILIVSIEFSPSVPTKAQKALGTVGIPSCDTGSGQQVDSSAEGGKFEKITVPAPGDESLHLPEIRGALRKPTRKT